VTGVTAEFVHAVHQAFIGEVYDMQSKAYGRIMIAAGAAVMLIVLIGSFFWPRAVATCGDAPANAEAAPLVISAQTELALNRKVCVGVNTGLYFKEEVAELSAREGVLEVAIASETLAREAFKQLGAPPKGDATALVKYKTDLAAVSAQLVEAKKAVTEARAKVADASRSRRLALFIDGVRTPAAFDVRVKHEGSWYWATPELSLPTGATAAEARTWRLMLSKASLDGIRRVHLSIGDADAALPRAAVGEGLLRFQVFEPWIVYPGAVALLLMMAGLIVWQWRSCMLRDRSPKGELKDAAGNPLEDADGRILQDNPPFSLGRLQLALWLLLTVGGFLYVWLVTGQATGIFTNEVVTVIGIAGASGAVAAAMGAPSASTSPTDARLQGDDTVNGVGADTIAGGDANDEIQSQNVLLDILSDNRGVVLHRVQMVVWTLVMGVIFAWSVVTACAFPAFDQALVLLSGVTSALYVGFKVPESLLRNPPS
jgi:hypothetical protein